MLRQALKNVVFLRPYPLLQKTCLQSTAAVASSNSKWDLLVGVQLERLPILSKSLNKIEREYQEFLAQVEFENSYKSEFEIQHENDLKLAELIKKGTVEVDLDAVSKQTRQDLKDLWREEQSKFQLAPRITDADIRNDLTSTERKLEDSLTLIVEQQIGNQKLFLLPQGKIGDGETLDKAAQRIIKETCGDSMEATLYGNAPCGFYKYTYPKSTQSAAVGAKVFFYRATVKRGQMDKKDRNFEWLDKDELLERVEKHNAYKKSLSEFII